MRHVMRWFHWALRPMGPVVRVCVCVRKASFTLGTDSVTFLNCNFTFDTVSKSTDGIKSEVAVVNSPDYSLMASVKSTDSMMKTHIETLCTKI